MTLRAARPLRGPVDNYKHRQVKKKDVPRLGMTMTLIEMINIVRTLKAEYGEVPSEVRVNSADYAELYKSLPPLPFVNKERSPNTVFGLRVILDESVTTPQFK